MQGRVLVTGATGFVGRALVDRKTLGGMRVRAAARRPVADWPSDVEIELVRDLAPTTDWKPALDGVKAVVHCAARVHVMREHVANPLAEFRRVNVDGTLSLARQAVDVGVRRFVFISSIKVNGECTASGRPYVTTDLPVPRDPYAVSKLEAEFGLRQLAEETQLEIVIIRPVLVYGPGVKANFQSMMQCLYQGFPLPLGAIHNLRSLVALDNLVDLIALCLVHSNAPSQTFFVSDGEDLSTTVLLRRTAGALGKSARLIPVPVPVLQTAARLLGKADLAQRLCDSLQVDISKTRELLGWSPPVSVDAALKRTAEHFLANLHRQ